MFYLPQLKLDQCWFFLGLNYEDNKLNVPKIIYWPIYFDEEEAKALSAQTDAKLHSVDLSSFSHYHYFNLYKGIFFEPVWLV